MPIGRYFAFAGLLLAGLLFLIDWYAPQTVARASGGEADRSIIRIHSAHKWPTAVVMDTTQPTIAPAPQPAASAEVAVEKPAPRAHEALAQVAETPAAETPAPRAAPAKHAKRRTKVARAAPRARIASYDSFGFQPFFQGGW